MSARTIKETIQAIAGQKLADNLFPARVVEVNGHSCMVESGGLHYTEVQLFSSNKSGNLIIKPTKGSQVMVADLSNGLRRQLCIVKVDEVELLEIKHNRLQLLCDVSAGTVQIANDSVSLGELLKSYAEILRSFKVNVLAPNAPSGPITPDVLAKVMELEAKIEKLFP